MGYDKETVEELEQAEVLVGATIERLLKVAERHKGRELAVTAAKLTEDAWRLREQLHKEEEQAKRTIQSVIVVHHYDCHCSPPGEDLPCNCSGEVQVTVLGIKDPRVEGGIRITEAIAPDGEPVILTSSEEGRALDALADELARVE